MQFYYFKGGNHIDSNKISKLEEAGFMGVLFKYAPWDGDYLVKISRDIKLNQKIKYMVAIRPYAISPQYLNMMSHGIESIMKDRFQVNLISGHIKGNEKEIGGILGEVNDNSTHIQRSNYLIEYMEELKRMKKEKSYLHSVDFFVTTTNEYVFNTAKKLNQKMIIPYREYKQKHWTKHDSDYKEWGMVTHKEGKTSYGEKIKIENETVMISMAPVLRKTKEELEKVSKTKRMDDSIFATYKEFNNFIKELESDGIKYLMLHPWPLKEENNIIEYVKYFNSTN